MFVILLKPETHFFVITQTDFTVAVELTYSCFTNMITNAGSAVLERKTYLYVMTGYGTTACRHSMYIIE